MQTEQIVALLIQERNRVDAAIAALGGNVKKRGRPVGSHNRTVAQKVVSTEPRKRKLSVAGRKRIADAARKRWAAINAAKASAGSAPKKK